MAEPHDLGLGVWHFQASLWQTNSVLVVDHGAVLACDPAFTLPEIEGIRAFSRREAGRDPAYVLVTHSDFDHVCGVALFGGAEVVACESTADAVASGAASEQLSAAALEWGVGWPTTIRVERAIVAGSEFSCGPFRIAAIDGRGHIGDGVGYVLLSQGLLLPGDYLSACSFPFVLDSLRAARATHERLLEAIEHYDLRWVVPGHGPALRPGEARAIGLADLEYLERLEASAAEARERGLSPGSSLLHVFAVEPPRRTTLDFEVYGLRAANAQRAIAEAASS